MNLAESDVKKYAISKNIKVFQPEKIRKNPNFIKEIEDLNADIACVVVYGKILPKSFLDLFPKGCINVHPSLLPKYRGAAPIQWAIINGDKKTGVCTMYLDVGMDDGDIIEKLEVDIGEDENAGELWDRLAVLGSKMLVKTVNDMSKINWEEKGALEIKNLIRGLTPGLGAFSTFNGKKIKFWKADVIEEKEFKKKYDVNINCDCGTVLISNEKDGLFIKTKNGILSILEIQGENAKRMSVYDFLRGNKILQLIDNEENTVLKKFE